MSNWALATSIPRKHGTSTIGTPVCPTLQIRAQWHQTTVRALGVQDLTTHAPLRSPWTKAQSVYHVRGLRDGDAPTSPTKDTRLEGVACKPLFGSARTRVHGCESLAHGAGSTSGTMCSAWKGMNDTFGELPGCAKHAKGCPTWLLVVEMSRTNPLIQLL